MLHTIAASGRQRMGRWKVLLPLHSMVLLSYNVGIVCLQVMNVKAADIFSICLSSHYRSLLVYSFYKYNHYVRILCNFVRY